MSMLALVLPPAAGAQARYPYVVSADGRMPQTQGEATAALLPRAGNATPLVAIVPAGALSWHRVPLPPGIALRSPRLRAVLEGLLEDHVLDDPAALHFALAPGARAGSPAWVAVCDRSWLKQHLQELDAAGRPVSRVVPEFEPGGERVLHATGAAGQVVLVATGEDGVVRTPLAMLSAAAAARWASDPLICEPAVAQEAERMLQRPGRLESTGERLLRAAASAWDLAQFDLVQARHSRRWRSLSAALAGLWHAPRWRPARWAAGLLVAVNLVGLNALAWKEERSLERKRAGVQAAFVEAFPGVRLVLPPALQMQREMTQLKQGTGALDEGDFEPVLQALALASPSGQHPRGVDFSAGETRIRGLDAAGDVTVALRSRGLQARADGGVLVVRKLSAP